MKGIGGSAPSEIKDLLSIFGRTSTEGHVKGDHLSKILNFLQMEKGGKYKSAVSKLIILCAMQGRYVKEQLEGLIEFGIIETYVSGNDVMWRWIGISAFEKKRTPKLGDNE